MKTYTLYLICISVASMTACSQKQEVSETVTAVSKPSEVKISELKKVATQKESLSAEKKQRLAVEESLKSIETMTVIPAVKTTIEAYKPIISELTPVMIKKEDISADLPAHIKNSTIESVPH